MRRETPLGYLACPLWLLAASAAAGAADRAAVGFRTDETTVVIMVDEQPVATYVFADPKIPRPYFAHVKGPGNVPLTRNHPPIPGVDRLDHDSMHPGIWLAFGDLDGADFWRNKARIEHQRFLEPPRGGPGQGSFVEEKQYVGPEGRLICRERFRCALHVRPDGYLLVWDSSFAGDAPFYFGDQEEMGLGLRVATPIAEVEGGRLRDSHGRRGAGNIWSQAANWCDYSGTVDERNLGMTLLCHPRNFRPSWMHARDYGFVAANPFGRHAMHKGEPSRVVVQPGSRLRLRYGVFLYALPRETRPDLGKVYADYLELSATAGSAK